MEYLLNERLKGMLLRGVLGEASDPPEGPGAGWAAGTRAASQRPRVRPPGPLDSAGSCRSRERGTCDTETAARSVVNSQKWAGATRHWGFGKVAWGL